MRLIDLRSDTVTKPTDEMRQAMVAAEVGDDVYGDDPTVHELQREAARISGFPRSLFVPSGTMGNQIAIMNHCARGDEAIVDRHCHIVEHEAGAAAALSCVNLFMLESSDGMMDIREVEDAVRDTTDIHYPKTSLICIENAHGGGTVTPISYMRDIRAVADRHGLKVHLDGARLFNAAHHLGVSPAEIAKYADSVMFCLSKGLAAPVGSMLCGSEEFIDQAIRARKRLGGGMRQTGILAAAGLVALRDMTGRLTQDHGNARLLARKLSEIPGIEIDVSKVHINMVFFRLQAPADGARLELWLRDRGVLTNPGDARGLVRLVTHYHITENDVLDVARMIDEFYG